jgi:hypothetical protein
MRIPDAVDVPLSVYPFFFWFYSYSHEAYVDYGGVPFDSFPAVVREVAARCKLPSAFRQACRVRIVKRAECIAYILHKLENRCI